MSKKTSNQNHKKSASNTLIKLRRLHPVQQEIKTNLNRFNVVSCGRRIGKSTLLVDLMVNAILAGKKVGVWLPNYKYIGNLRNDLLSCLPQNLITINNRSENIIELTTGGTVIFYSLANQPDAGRGYKFHLALVDEGSLIPGLVKIVDEVIEPTLMDFAGTLVITGTPKGKNDFHRLFLRENIDALWSSFTASTFANPHLPQSEKDRILERPKTNYILQEYYAEFLDSGGEFFEEITQSEPTNVRGPFKIGIDIAKMNDFTVVAVFDRNNQMVEMLRINQESYEQILRRITALLEKYPQSEITLDNTGVGNPIADRLEANNYQLNRFNFTEGSRNRILENLAVLISEDEVTFLPNEEIKTEFEAFERIMLPSGKTKIQSAIHDDIVMACALALSQNDTFEFLII